MQNGRTSRLRARGKQARQPEAAPKPREGLDCTSNWVVGIGWLAPRATKTRKASATCAKLLEL